MRVKLVPSWYAAALAPVPKNKFWLFPSGLSARVILPPPSIIPSLAVITPTESILVTSSYVNVPPILTFPVKVASTAVTLPLKFPSTPPILPLPEKLVAVTTPVNTAPPASYIVAPVPIGVSAPRTLIPAI